MGTRTTLRRRASESRRREQQEETRWTSPESPAGRSGKDISVSQTIIPFKQPTNDPTTRHLRRRVHRCSDEDGVSPDATERKPREVGLPESKSRDRTTSSRTRPRDAPSNSSYRRNRTRRIPRSTEKVISQRRNDGGARFELAPPRLGYSPSCCLIVSSIWVFIACRLKDAGACIGG